MFSQTLTYEAVYARFVDAVGALVDDPSAINVIVYLRASRDLDEARRDDSRGFDVAERRPRAHA